MEALTIAVCATGPSITQRQVDVAREKGFRLFVCNNAFLLAPDAELLYACNLGWWQHYWPQVKDLGCQKWTVNRQASDTFGINWIDEKNEVGGFSTDPSYIHSGYGSGYSLCSMAYRAGAKRIILLGYSLSYANDYNASSRFAGSTPRHSELLLPGGEYPAGPLSHWPSVKVRNGVHVELLELYRMASKQIEIVNSTPNSALTAFIPYTPIDDVI